MTKSIGSAQFASLFKKYRLRSEIETLSEFGDLLANEGMVYDSSLFTKWQKGIRVPKDRKTLLSILRVFSKRGGVHFLHEANDLLESAGQGYVTETEITDIPSLHKHSPFQAPRKIEHFIGRSSYIEKVCSSLFEGRTILIYGQPGIGKTVLATDIAHQVSKYFSDGVFWYQLNTASVMDILASIAELFGHNIRNIQDITIRSSIVRSLTAKKKVLFIFDNMERQEDLIYLMPNNNSCSVLITSIHPCVSTREIDMRIALKPFTQKESLSLFEEILGKDYVIQNTAEILKLYTLVDGLPLALHVLAKHILYYQKPLSSFIRSLKTTHTNLSNFSYENKDLHTVLRICFNRLKQYEQDILVSASVFSGKDFSIEAIAEINNIDKDKAERYLEQLWNFSLIEQSETRRYRVHPFVRIFLLSYLKKSTYVKCAQYFYETIKKKKKTYFIFLQKELDNILPLYDQNSLIEAWPSLSGIWFYLSDYLWNAGKWDTLKIYSHYIYGLSDKYKDYTTKIRVLLLPLSLVYYWRDDLIKAEQYINEGLTLARKIEDDYLIHLGNQRLGRMLIASNQDESLKLLMSAYSYFSSIQDKVQVGIIETNLGEIPLRKGDLKNALSQFQSAKIACNDIEDISLKYICISEILFYLGEINILQNNWKKAHDLFVEGLNQCKKINEYSEISTAGYIGLGLYYEHENKVTKALECFHKVVEQIEFLGIKESIIKHDTFYYAIIPLIEKSAIFRSFIKQ